MQHDHPTTTPRATTEPARPLHGTLTHERTQRPEPDAGAPGPFRSSCHLSMGRKEGR